MGYIYKITNTVNKKIYIGETLQEDVNRRWNTHKYLAKVNKGCPALKEAINKYRIDNFKFEIIIICFDEDRLFYEKEYIKKYNSVVPNGYNISEGGCEKGFTGLHHTEEVKQKISAAVKTRYSNPEEREKASIKIKKVYAEQNIIEKRKNGEKWKLAMAEGRIGKYHHGKQHSEETKKKISEAVNKQILENKDFMYNDKFKQKVCKKINQLTLTGEYVKTHESITQAARSLSLHHNTIQSVLSKRSKTAGGYKWEYTPSTDT